MFVKKSPTKIDKEAEISRKIIRCAQCGKPFMPQLNKSGAANIDYDATSTLCPSCFTATPHMT